MPEAPPVTSAVEPARGLSSVVHIAADPRTGGNLRADPRVRFDVVPPEPSADHQLVLSQQPSCVEVLAVINCYVDCECDATTMLVIAAHLDVCCDCCEQLAQMRWLKSAVRRCGGRPNPRQNHGRGPDLVSATARRPRRVGSRTSRADRRRVRRTAHHRRAPSWKRSPTEPPRALAAQGVGAGRPRHDRAAERRRVRRHHDRVLEVGRDPAAGLRAPSSARARRDHRARGAARRGAGTARRRRVRLPVRCPTRCRIRTRR